MVNYRDKLAIRTKEAQKRLALIDTLKAEAGLGDIIDESEKSPLQRTGLDSNSLTQPAEQEITRMEQMGLFTSQDLVASDQISTLLARLPIFPPADARMQKKRLDDSNAYSFTTPWGSGRRHGPLLTTRDEDTLLAILHLRKKRLTGKAANLPIRKSDLYPTNKNGDLCVHTIVCTVTQINNILGLADGGPNFAITLKSVKDLGATVLEVETNSHQRYFGEMKKGAQIKIIDVQWTTFDEYGVLVIQVDPIVAGWLESSFSYLDLSIRKKLRGSFAKCLHRFLSTQVNRHKGFKRELSKIATTIGYAGRDRDIKSNFEKAINQLIDLDWLKSGEITGTGRKTPFVLNVFWPTQPIVKDTEESA